jgi:hypothetical protein
LTNVSEEFTAFETSVNIYETTRILIAVRTSNLTVEMKLCINMAGYNNRSKLNIKIRNNRTHWALHLERTDLTGYLDIL